MTGRLSIPYYDLTGLAAIQFRCITDHDHKLNGCPKYLGPKGQTLTLFNLPALRTGERTIHVTEGAFDAIVLSDALGMPVVGVPGADAWRPHWPNHFDSFDRVILWRHGDPAGAEMAARWQKAVNAEIIHLPAGTDVNDLYRDNSEQLEQIWRSRQ